MVSQKRIGFIMGISAAIFWGTFGTFSTLLSKAGLSEGTISLIAPLFLLVFFTILVAKDDIHHMVIAKKMIPALILNGLSSAAYNYSAVQAYSHLPIGVVSTIIYCNLFLLIIVSRLVFKIAITWQKVLAVFGAIIGISMVVNVFGANGSLSLVGIAWAVFAMVCWTSLVTFEKYLLIHNVDSNAILAYEGIFSLVFISTFMHSPVQAISEVGKTMISTSGLVLLPLLAFGLLTTVLCYWLYINALNRLEPAYVQIAYTLDPVTACLLGFFLFGQALLPLQFAGIALILIVVIWVQWIERDAPTA